MGHELLRIEPRVQASAIQNPSSFQGLKYFECHSLASGWVYRFVPLVRVMMKFLQPTQRLSFLTVHLPQAITPLSGDGGILSDQGSS